MRGLHIKLMTTGEVRDVPNPVPYEESYVEWGIRELVTRRYTGSSSTPIRHINLSALGLCRFWAVRPRKLRDNFAPWSVSSEGKIACTAQAGPNW